MYYLRTRPKADAIQFTVDQISLAQSRKVDTPSSSSSSSSSSTTKISHHNTNNSNNNNGHNVNVLSTPAPTKGLDYEPEVACESCSA